MGWNLFLLFFFFFCLEVACLSSARVSFDCIVFFFFYSVEDEVNVCVCVCVSLPALFCLLGVFREHEGEHR